MTPSYVLIVVTMAMVAGEPLMSSKTTGHYQTKEECYQDLNEVIKQPEVKYAMCYDYVNQEGKIGEGYENN